MDDPEPEQEYPPRYAHSVRPLPDPETYHATISQSRLVLHTPGDECELDQDGVPLMIPYEPSSDEDESDLLDPNDPRYTDPAWETECLLDNPEDIDFEFVYALHTFVATVEGQANATKGDTMVLLDDSNSYWWLVRVVKDSSIGTFASFINVQLTS